MQKIVEQNIINENKSIIDVPINIQSIIKSSGKSLLSYLLLAATGILLTYLAFLIFFEISNFFETLHSIWSCCTFMAICISIYLLIIEKKYFLGPALLLFTLGVNWYIFGKIQDVRDVLFSGLYYIFYTILIDPLLALLYLGISGFILWIADKVLNMIYEIALASFYEIKNIPYLTIDQDSLIVKWKKKLVINFDDISELNLSELSEINKTKAIKIKTNPDSSVEIKVEENQNGWAILVSQNYIETDIEQVYEVIDTHFQKTKPSQQDPNAIVITTATSGSDKGAV
ncbi:MAG: hypothetical protein IKW83_10895 [Muribaculaceae bacterium]|nr:hypothetical protein [Muribaculaceae bacterium]